MTSIFRVSSRTGETLKLCSKCMQYKSLVEYDKNRTAKHGIVSQCKECKKKQRRKFKNREDMFWKRHWPRTVQVGDCLEWKGSYTNRGQPRVKWDGKYVSVRRLVYKLACGELPSDMVVKTTCRNNKCVKQSHLVLLTRNELDIILRNNMPNGDESAYRKYPERFPRGEQCKKAKLTESDVIAIRSLRNNDNLPMTVIARQFGVSPSAVSAIMRHQAWKHVQ